MRLRNQLLLLALATLVLPLAGWQFARGLEERLREGQATALLDVAGAYARLLASAGLELPPDGPVLALAVAERTLVPDGDAADWTGQGLALQRVAEAPGGAKLSASLARSGAAVHLLVALDGANATGLRLLYRDGDELHALRFGAGGSGPLSARSEQGEALAPARLVAAGQRIANGYRWELRLPPGITPSRLGIEALPVQGEPLGTAPDRIDGLWPLVATLPALERRLATLLPSGLRARVLHPGGFELAVAGELEASDAMRPPGMLARLYRLLSGGADDGAIDAAVLQRVSAGERLGLWQPGVDGRLLQLSALVPLESGGRHAVLAVERRSDAARLAQQALGGLLGVSLLALLAVGGALFGYASWLGLRVRRLGRAVDQAMAAERGAPPDFPVSRAGDELGELSRRFARLLEELAAHTQYLRSLAGSLSHELHTPLAVVGSSLENLEAEGIPEASRPYLERARDGHARLAAIVRAMSAATRVERAIASSDSEIVDLVALVGGCAEGYRPLLAPRRLRVELPEGPLLLRAAPELLAQALDKLVENARSFCPDNGEVRIALVPIDGGARVEVDNSGPPLPTGTASHLFDSLVSLRAPDQRRDAGPHLGLGLHIVRLITELHRGEASAHNLAGGRGVRFVLELAGTTPPVPGAAR